MGKMSRSSSATAVKAFAAEMSCPEKMTVANTDVCTITGVDAQNKTQSASKYLRTARRPISSFRNASILVLKHSTHAMSCATNRVTACL